MNKSLNMNNKALEAAEILKLNCSVHQCNSVCIFFSEVESACKLYKAPYTWELTDSIPWSKADADLARAMRAFGYKTISRLWDNQVVFNTDSPFGGGIPAPVTAFEPLMAGHIVDLEDLIAEYEQAQKATE